MCAVSSVCPVSFSFLATLPALKFPGLVVYVVSNDSIFVISIHNIVCMYMCVQVFCFQTDVDFCIHLCVQNFSSAFTHCMII